MGIILLLTALDYLARDVLQSIYHPVKVLTSVNDAFYRHWRCSGYGIHLIISILHDAVDGIELLGNRCKEGVQSIHILSKCSYILLKCS